jgi:hypothetical protein
VLALLRCRNRLEQILEIIAEPRRSELARVLSELDDRDDTDLRQMLGEMLGREDAVLRDAVARALRPGAEAPRPINRWIARRIGL